MSLTQSAHSYFTVQKTKIGLVLIFLTKNFMYYKCFQNLNES